MSAPESFPFLLLPIELRQSVYDLLISESILAFPRWGTIYESWPVAPAKDNLALEITTSNTFLKSFRLESSLIYTNRQIYAEFSDHIYKQVRHLRITGDFLMGVKSTQKILDSITSRPWICANVRAIRLVIALSRDRRQTDLFWNDVHVDQEYPWIRQHFQAARASLAGVPPYPRQRIWPSDLNTRQDGEMGLRAVRSDRALNTLSDLARLLEAFPLLERLDITFDDKNVYMLWPNPMDSLRPLAPLHAKEIEFNVALRGWRRTVFLAIMVQLGFDDAQAVLLDKEGPKDDYSLGTTRGGGIMTRTLFDWFPRVEEQSEEVSAPDT
jgi:hypothetical protein